MDYGCAPIIMVMDHLFAIENKFRTGRNLSFLGKTIAMQRYNHLPVIKV
jgi:hypothetical protein